MEGLEEVSVIFHGVILETDEMVHRDWSLFFAHLATAAILGVFCGGLYFHTGITIAGFQSRVGCLFFLVCSVGTIIGKKLTID